MIISMPPCPYCNSKITVLNGHRYIQNGKVQRYLCNKCGRCFTEDSGDKEIVIENVKYKKETQRYRDSNRIERKAFREWARVENSIGEYNKELVNILKNYDLSKYTQFHKNPKSKGAGIFHFTDPHFNELIELSFNKSDFSILSKRCKKFVDQAKRYFKLFKVSNILFAMTGDMLNSDRKLDELLAQATNRSRAMVLAVIIIEQMLLDLNKDFNIKVVCVSGNESRKSEEIGWTNMITTNNYDFDIFEILGLLFRKSVGVIFERGDDPLEQVIEVGGQNILILHGLTIEKEIERAIQRKIGQYTARDIIIDFVIFGHKHSCRIGDTYSRGSSVIGANDYSEKALHMTGRASQNIHIIFDKNNRDSIKIDLQNITGIEGYKIEKELEAYHIKSAMKLKKPITIHKVVI